MGICLQYDIPASLLFYGILKLCEKALILLLRFLNIQTSLQLVERLLFSPVFSENDGQIDSKLRAALILKSDCNKADFF